MIAGTTSRPRSYYWEFCTPRDMAARIVALPGEKTAPRSCSARSATGSAPKICSTAMCWCGSPANPDYCSLNLAIVGAAVELRDLHGGASNREPKLSSNCRSRRQVTSSISTIICIRCSTRSTFGDRTGHLMERLRRLFNRAQLDRNELNILRGILSAVQGRRGQARRGAMIPGARPPTPCRGRRCISTTRRPRRSIRAWRSAWRNVSRCRARSAIRARSAMSTARRRARWSRRPDRRWPPPSVPLRRHHLDVRRHRSEQPRDFRHGES